jgi:hypothetical protein
MLEVGAGIHLELAFSHGGTNFGTASLFAAAAQMVLGFAIALRRSDLILRLALTTELVLAQLYVLSVTIGLPPVIAHVHDGRVHEVFGLIFAVPSLMDLAGVLALTSEICGAFAAASILRAREPIALRSRARSGR